MAVKKKPVETIADNEEKQDIVEVELADMYKGYTGIHLRYALIPFINDKAKVSQETADQLRLNGFVK